MPLRYRLSMTLVGQRLEIVDEAVENEGSTKPAKTDVDFFYRFQGGVPPHSTVVNGRALERKRVPRASCST